MLRSSMRSLLAVAAVLGALSLVATDADARVGRGGSFGSRGGRTFSAPPPTSTAPSTARPIERSMTQPSAIGRPAAAPATGPFGRSGFLGGLAAGFLGAGLLGMLFGGGLFGGLGGGIASFLGLLVQIALVVIVGRLLWTWWQRRSQPQGALAGGPAAGRSEEPVPNGLERLGLGPLGGARAGMFGGGGSSPGLAGASEAAQLTARDFDAFERLLTEVQSAYGREDLAALRGRVTPEMLSYFSEELAGNASRGVVNEISDVKLLKGDLAEAWREGDTEYATVAMRYSLLDRTVERATGRIVDGDAGRPTEVTELWTFMRSRGGDWLLSAIQQT